MNSSLYRLIESALELDPSLRQKEKDVILACCRTPARFMDDMKPPEDRLLTISDVCSALKISKTTVWRMTTDGALQSVQVSGSPRYRKSDIDAIVSAGKVQQHV